MAESPSEDRTENQLGTVEPYSRRTRWATERRQGQAAGPRAVLAARGLAKWPCVVCGRQSSLDSAEEHARLVKTVKLQWLVSEDRTGRASRLSSILQCSDDMHRLYDLEA